MDEKRQLHYSFSSKKDLIAFFSPILPKKTILEVMHDIQKKFTRRENTSSAEHKIQFLKKCEWELVRLSKKMFFNPDKTGT